MGGSNIWCVTPMREVKWGICLNTAAVLPPSQLIHPNFYKGTSYPQRVSQLAMIFKYKHVLQNEFVFGSYISIAHTFSFKVIDLSGLQMTFLGELKWDQLGPVVKLLHLNTNTNTNTRP